ncbi:hypothetical protein GCM10023210_36770 [Chryseobacterium ginsengisoli]|uniref:Uncharacterized protein n=1 Tax=Chryseobacterium ginsengisoli TaxID=363853 RepID=A0ABP9MT87_9FLAO
MIGIKNSNHSSYLYCFKMVGIEFDEWVIEEISALKFNLKSGKKLIKKEKLK